MGNFAEMFNLITPQSDRDRAADLERRKKLLEILTAAEQPEPIAPVHVEPEQSRSGSIADSLLAGLSDGLMTAATSQPSNSAMDKLIRMREDRQRRIDYNARAARENEHGYKKARAKAESMLEMRELDAQDRAVLDAAAVKREQDKMAAQQRFQNDQRVAEETWRAEQQKREQDWRAGQEEKDRSLRLRLEGIERGAVGDKFKEKWIETQNQYLIDSRLKAKEDIVAAVTKNPDADLDAVRQDYEDSIEAIGLAGEYKESAMLFFDKVAARYRQPEPEQPNGPVSNPLLGAEVSSMLPAVPPVYSGPVFEFSRKEQARRSKQRANSQARSIVNLDVKR